MTPQQSAARPRQEIAVAVVERDGSFLIGQREAPAALAGYWEFPGGKLESGEAPEAAAIRECLEETGLEVRVTGAYPTTSHNYDHAAVLLHFLACKVIDQRHALPDRFRWVTARELSEYQFPPANQTLLAHLTRKRAT
jgi:8-oxo-dGTP diphosphatase